MRKLAILIFAFIFSGLLTYSQSIKWSAVDIKELTPEWTGDLTSDGRPKVSDDLLERFVDVTPEEFEEAFLEWIDTYPNLPVTKNELMDYRAKRGEAAA